MTGMENNGRKCTSYCILTLGAEGERGEVPAGPPALVGLSLAVAVGVEVEGECETSLLVYSQCTQLSESKRPCLTAAIQVAHRAAGGVVFPELTGEPPKPASPVPCVAAASPLLQKRKLKCICHLRP